MKELLEDFINIDVRLVKDDNFVITGRIKKVTDTGILFYTAGRDTIISFDRIKEVVPLGGR